MADFPTFQDLFRVARDEVLSRNASLRRNIVERPGSDANALTAASAATGDEVVGQLIRVQAGLFLDTARREKLDRLVFDRYQLKRKPAGPALGEVEVTSVTPAPIAFAIDAGTRFRTLDGKVFTAVATVNYPLGSTGPVTVPVQSVLAGLSQQAKPNTITSVIDLPAGAPGDLAANNPLATAGASDEESDDALRVRAKRFYTTSKRGTLKAIERGALDLQGVRTATAFEALEIDGEPARVVNLVVADSFTQQLVNAQTVPAEYDDQAEVLAAQVQAGLQDVRAAGIGVSVTVANVVLLSVTLALRFRAGADIDAAATQARTVIANYTNSLRPGATWDRSAANELLRGVPGLVVVGNGAEIFRPSGDVIPNPLQVLRTSSGLVVIGNEIDQEVATTGGEN
jgi:uncharacterized phage protein gp47/JayE